MLAHSNSPVLDSHKIRRTGEIACMLYRYIRNNNYPVLHFFITLRGSVFCNQYYRIPHDT